ncbi:hypothetical protein DB346_23535 [Verrucomicrobia bacterium LW23]|nr:hypothetical protein DB346_23535 [Verrucomicrobia bacterium LW23]
MARITQHFSVCRQFLEEDYLMSSIFHLEYKGKSSKLSLQRLPDQKPPPVVVLKTPAGPVSSARAINGYNRGADLSKLTGTALIEGDPELEVVAAGQVIDSSTLTTAYYDRSAENPAPVPDFNEIDIVLNANGEEKERRPRPSRRPNIDELHPVRIVRRLPLKQALTQFVFRFTRQVVHVDGLTRDFLFSLAEDLHNTQELALLGAGAKSRDPLVLQERGTPCRGFLYGEIGTGADAGKYKLLLLLSDMEIKLPDARKAAAAAE